MKKFVVMLFFCLFLFSLVSSAGIDSLNEQVGSVSGKVQDKVGQIEETKETLSVKETRDAYLKKQLVTILENKPFFKQVIATHRKISPYTDPAIEFFVGMTPVFSLFFVLVLVIWFFLVKYYFTIYDILRDFSTFSDLTSFVISFGFFIILIVLQFFQDFSIFLANKVTSLISFFTSPIMQVLGFVIFVVAMVFLSKFSKQVRVLVRYIRMWKYKQGIDSKQTELLSRQEGATKVVETIAKAVVDKK